MDCENAAKFGRASIGYDADTQVARETAFSALLDRAAMLGKLAAEADSQLSHFIGRTIGPNPEGVETAHKDSPPRGVVGELGIRLEAVERSLSSVLRRCDELHNIA